jgi:SAM-dependent methyltransferase
MKELQQVLNQLPDKWESKTTTSKKWKEGLYEFIQSNNIDSILEIGSSVGHTTYFVAHYVSKVTSVEILTSKLAESKARSSHHTNIDFRSVDVYNRPWDFGYHDLVIIDCIHEYKYVKQDIANAIQLGTKYIAFDDYGLFPEIKQAIDEEVAQGRLEILEEIGYPIGTCFHMSKSSNTTPDKVLIGPEGLICKVI